MDTRQEIVRYDRMRHFSMYITRVEYMMSHMHGSFELSYVLEGSGQCTIGAETVKLEPGQLVLLNPYEVHSFVSQGEQPLVVLTAQFHRLFLRRYIERIPKLRFLGGSIEALSYNQYQELVYLLKKAGAVYFTESESQQFDILTCAILLMGKLVSYLEWELDESPDGAEKELRQRRTQRLMSYIDENFRQKITLAQLAEMEGISTTHLSHFFHKAFGMTFQAYLTTQRIEKAVVLLRDPTVPLSEIFMRCGFSDHRYLEAACQKIFGCGVVEYRSRCEAAEEQGQLPDNVGLYKQLSWEESFEFLKKYLSPETMEEWL